MVRIPAGVDDDSNEAAMYDLGEDEEINLDAMHEDDFDEGVEEDEL